MSWVVLGSWEGSLVLLLRCSNLSWGDDRVLYCLQCFPGRISIHLWLVRNTSIRLLRACSQSVVEVMLRSFALTGRASVHYCSHVLSLPYFLRPALHPLWSPVGVHGYCHGECQVPSCWLCSLPCCPRSAEYSWSPAWVHGFC